MCAELKINADDELILSTWEGVSVNLRDAHLTTFKRLLREMTRQSILRRLQERINGRGGGKTRKDMVGISHHVNIEATTQWLSAKRSRIPGLTPRLFRQVILSIITGSLRTLDKRLRAQEVETDVCPHCQVRETTHHLVWECGRFQHTRQRYQKRIEGIQRKLGHPSSQSNKRLSQIMSTASWRCCGIANELDEIVQTFIRHREIDDGLKQPVSREQLISFSTPGVRLHTDDDGGLRVKIFTDGSATHTESFWKPRAAWALWASDECPCGRAGGVLQTACSFRAELRAALEAIQRAASPILLICDCTGVVSIVTALSLSRSRLRQVHAT